MNNLPDYYKVAEVELIYKSTIKPSDRPRLSNANETQKLLRPLYGETMEHHESFWILLLSRAHKILGAYKVGSGGLAGCVADPKLIFQTAIKANASGIILSHNHPSGNLEPSKADLELTKKIKAGGDILEIQVLDHVIMSPEGFLSFANEGYL